MMWRALACSVSSLLLSCSAIASDFGEFRIPPSTRSSYSLSFVGNASRESRVEPGVSSRFGSMFGDVAGGYSRDRDSDPVQWNVRFDGAVRAQRNREERDSYDEVPGPGGPLETEASSEENSRRYVQEVFQLSAGTRCYPFERPIGLEAAGEIGLTYGQQWFRQAESTIQSAGGPVLVNDNHRSSSDWLYAQGGSIDLGAGYGRVRDATAVFEVALLEERLGRDGLLVRPVSAAARRKLAELFSLRSSFDVAHDLPEKFFWREVERLLREDGALVESGLDAFAVQHAAEQVVVAKSFVRRAGWFIGPLVSARYTHQVRRFDQASDSRTTSDGVPMVESWVRTSSRLTWSSDVIMYGGQLQVRLPLGTRTQLDWEERALVAGEDETERLIVNGLVRFQHLVAERWLFSANAYHQRSMQGGDSRGSSWGVGSGAGLAYFLEDALNLSLNVDHAQFQSEGMGSFPDELRGSNLRVTLAIQLARGRFDAPGLIPPVRAMN